MKPAHASAVPHNSPRKFRPFLQLGMDRGVDVEGLLAAEGLTLDVMQHPDTRLPRPQCVSILRTLLARLRDPLAGLHAADRFVLEDTDYMMATSHVAISLLAGTSIAALGVELARSRPRTGDRIAAYRRFFGGPVHFEADRSRLVYPEPALHRPIPSSDLRLALLLRQQADARLPSGDRPASFSDQVRRRLRAQLRAGKPDPAELARALRMSGRTLRRRLAATGSSYRDLLDDVRREEALRLVQSSEVSVREASDRLGFKDASAFARAFRRWTGHSPSQLKQGRGAR